MSDVFNPYRDWLGIPEHQLPPNYYRLLGIELYESDPTVISSAADRIMLYVRTFQTGPKSSYSQQILNEISTARICLLNVQSKAGYDDQLRRKLFSSIPAAPLPITPAVPIAQPMPVTPIAQAVPVTPVAQPMPVTPIAQAMPVTPIVQAMPVTPVAQPMPVTPVAQAMPVTPVAQAMPVTPIVQPTPVTQPVSSSATPASVSSGSQSSSKKVFTGVSEKSGSGSISSGSISSSKSGRSGSSRYNTMVKGQKRSGEAVPYLIAGVVFGVILLMVAVNMPSGKGRNQETAGPAGTQTIIVPSEPVPSVISSGSSSSFSTPSPASVENDTEEMNKPASPSMTREEFNERSRKSKNKKKNKRHQLALEAAAQQVAESEQPVTETEDDTDSDVSFGSAEMQPEIELTIESPEGETDQDLLGPEPESTEEPAEYSSDSPFDDGNSSMPGGDNNEGFNSELNGDAGNTEDSYTPQDASELGLDLEIWNESPAAGTPED